jgi:hypothetical protein
MRYDVAVLGFLILLVVILKLIGGSSTNGEPSFSIDQIATPAGFASIEDVSDTGIGYYREILGDTAKLVAVYVTAEDAAEFRAGKFPKQERFALVRSAGKTLSTRTEKQFEKLLSDYKTVYSNLDESISEVESAAEAASGRISRFYDEPINVSIEKIVLAETIRDDYTCLSHLFLVKKTFEAAGSRVGYIDVVATAIIQVDGIAISLEVCSKYTTIEDSAWAKATLIQWLPSFFENAKP